MEEGTTAETDVGVGGKAGTLHHILSYNILAVRKDVIKLELGA